MVDLLSAVEPWEAGDGDKLTPPADAYAWVAHVAPPPHVHVAAMGGALCAQGTPAAGGPLLRPKKAGREIDAEVRSPPPHMAVTHGRAPLRA